MTWKDQIEDLGAKRDKMIHLLEGWDEAQLAQQPAEGGWCALEVLDHIITSERGTLGYMMKKTSSGYDGLEVVEEKHRLASRQLNEALLSPSRWSAPAVLPPPDPSLNYDDLKETWIKTQDGLARFAASVPNEHAGKLVFKHPIAGRFTLEHTLDFLRFHIDHHMHQLDRIQNSITT